MRLIDADTLRHWIEGECKSPSIPRNEAAFGKRILMHMEVMKSEDVQPVMHGEWIPCSERLPEKDTCFYLATIANHGLNFTTTLPDDVDVVRWDYDRRKGYNSWHWCTERTVIAWMPLPEPYKGDE